MTFRAKKDPDAVLDFSVTWADWLAVGDTVTAHAVVAAAGITLDSSSRSDAEVTAWLSGGTPGENYKVIYEVTTAAGRKDQRTLDVYVAER